MSVKVYLAGPITGLTHDEAKGTWRQQVKDAFLTPSPMRRPYDPNAKDYPDNRVSFYCPMRNNESVNDGKPISATDAPPAHITSDRGVMMRDKWDVKSADIVFVNLCSPRRISVGTVIEIAWAHLLDKPCIVCMEEDNVHRHAMLNNCASIIVPTLEDGIQVLKDML